VAVADLNGDGKPDLITANRRGNSSTVSVLLGRGDGTFAPKTDFPVGMDPYFVAVADLNGDGEPDLITANLDSSGVTVLLGKGDGTFGPRTDYGVGGEPESLAVGELNGDGHLDFVTANIDTDTVSVRLNSGIVVNGPALAPLPDSGTGVNFPGNAPGLT